MYLRILIALTFGLLACGAETGEQKKDLDPFMVSLAGENYENLMLKKSQPLASDTVQLLKIPVDSFVFDLRKGQKRLSHEFTVYNEGTEISTILNYHSYCACFHPMGQIIFVNPAESAQLNVTFDPRAWKAGETKNLYVRTTHFPHLYTLKIKRKNES